MNDVLSEPAVLVSLVALIDLIAQKKPVTGCVKGTIKTIIGFVILGVEAGLVVPSLSDFANIFQHTFGTQGVIPSNEAIVSVAQKSFGKGMAMIVFFAMVISIMIVRFTPWKFVFLTGHHTLFMSMMVAIILTTAGATDATLIAAGSLVAGVAMVFFPVIAYPYVKKVTGSDDVAIGHFSTLSYVLAGFTGSKFDNKEYSAEDMNVLESLLFLYNTPVVIFLTVSIIFLVAYLLAGTDAVKELNGGRNWFVLPITRSITSTAGVYTILQGVRMVITEIVPAFKSISDKLVPNARPALDYPAVLPYAPNAVLVGFLSSSVTDLVGMSTLYLLNMIVIIPDVAPHFFVDVAAGVFGDVTGGRRSTILSAFAQGLFITFLPVFLLPVLGDIGFTDTTFGDADPDVLGTLLGIIVYQYFDDINTLQDFRNVEGTNSSCFLRFSFFQSGLYPVNYKHSEKYVA